MRRGNAFAFPLYAFMLMQSLTAANLPSLSMNAAILSNLSLAILFFVGLRLVERPGADGRAVDAAPA